MLESKKLGLTVSLQPCRLVGDVSIGLCFPLSVNGCALARLNGCAGCGTECFPSGSEESAIGHSLYLAVRQILCGDPLAVSKTKVGDVSCVGHNGMFGINWKVKGTGSAVRKSIGLALKVLDPVKMFSSYSRCVKLLGGSADRDCFNHVASQAAAAVKSTLQVCVIGNIKSDQAKLDAIVEVLAKKHDVTAIAGTKTKPTAHTQCDHANYTELKTAGWGTATLDDFLQNKVRGLVPMLSDKHLLVPMKPAQWATLASKLKKSVKEYVAAKYTKVGDELPAVFGYLALSSASLCASDVKSAINSKLSAASIESAINKGLE